MPSWRQRFRTGVLLIAMTCYLSKLDATTLDLTATVVRDGRAVLDARDLQTGGLERADGGLAAASGTLDEDGDLLEAVLHRHLGGLLGGSAANGVDLREPLNPTVPADCQEMTFPRVSVMETIVLLNVLLM